MTIRVLMHPHLNEIQPLPTNGISNVVKNYFEHLPNHGIELLPPGSDDADLVAIHAGATNSLPATIPVVAHNHGLYWTADDPNMGIWTHEMNHAVINVARRANAITVPSRWVAEVFRRDMHLTPTVVPHGVDWDEWQEGAEDDNYVLWNKNRSSDACDPMPVNELAMRAPMTRFLSTYAAPDPRPNIKVIGTVDFEHMKSTILKCSVYLATTKETFGIGTLEAMAAGKPVLGFDYGGTADLVTHGYSGYLAKPGNYEDLVQGLRYCLDNRETLGANARKSAKQYTWQDVAQKVAHVYAFTLDADKADRGTVGVVIPMYNKAGTVLRAVRSAIAQTHKPNCVYVVNNNSTDDYADQIAIAQEDVRAAGVGFVFLNCTEQGVAHARNLGISLSAEDHICCLDADDEMLPEFLERCRRELLWDRRLGVVYTGMEVVHPEGKIAQSQWPGEFDFDAMLKGRNQVPTCCLFRREAWVRAGGYRQRYAPNGAGSEDAALWLEMFLLGYGGKMATPMPLFRYYLGGLVSGNPDYREKNWRDKGWLQGDLPFAAPSRPANSIAHPVRQYDQPEVSIIIPVSAKHIDLVIDAIDSVESQTFRKWELILVADGHSRQDVVKWERYKQSFPFATFRTTNSAHAGAGSARNIGVAVAKAPLILFLDADDWFDPTAIEQMMKAHRGMPEAIIYSDYIGHAYIEDKALLTRLRAADRLVDYNNKTREATVRYHAFDYDCVRAQSQPIQGQDPYIWNVVSSLIPTAYFNQVGGFDVTMESWEDWDLFVRLAKAGHCFQRLAQPLLHYRFYTGERRSLANPGESGDAGRQLSSHLLQYMHSKYEGIENMPCSGCGGGRRNSPVPAPMTPMTVNQGKIANMSAGDMVMVELIDGNVGDHLIAFAGTSYGYHVHGDKFNMQREHARLDRRVRVLGEAPVVAQAIQPMPPPPSGVAAGQKSEQQVAVTPQLTPGFASTAPKIAEKTPNPGPPPYDFTRVWGINEENGRAELLASRGIRTLDGLIMYGSAKIGELFGMDEVSARRVVSSADKLKEADTKKRMGTSKKK